MTFHSKHTKPGTPKRAVRPMFADVAELAPGSSEVPGHRASAVRNIEQQCLRVLRCTAQDLAGGAGGLRFTPGTRPWLAGLVPAAALRALQRGGSCPAPALEPRC